MNPEGPKKNILDDDEDSIDELDSFPVPTEEPKPINPEDLSEKQYREFQESIRSALEKKRRPDDESSLDKAA